LIEWGIFVEEDFDGRARRCKRSQIRNCGAQRVHQGAAKCRQECDGDHSQNGQPHSQLDQKKTGASRHPRSLAGPLGPNTTSARPRSMIKRTTSGWNSDSKEAGCAGGCIKLPRRSLWRILSGENGARCQAAFSTCADSNKKWALQPHQSRGGNTERIQRFGGCSFPKKFAGQIGTPESERKQREARLVCLHERKPQRTC
jgi:hypothetical protein